MKLKKILASILCVAMVLSTMSFSVFAAEEPAQYWSGAVDTTWYNETDDEGNKILEFTLTTAEQLAGFANLVDEGNTFEDKTIKLGVNLDLRSIPFNPIGHSSNGKSFKGTFDGQGHTIANLYEQSDLDAWQYEGEYYGLFAYTDSAKIMNLTIADAYISSGRNEAAGVVGNAVDTQFSDITISNTTLIAYNNSAGGVAAECYGDCSFTNIIVDSDTVIGPLWGTYDVRLGGVVGMVKAGNNVSFTNVDVACQLDAINDVAANYQYWLYRYCGMLIGQVDGVNGVADPTGYVTCEDVTVTIGKWANYHYCEDANLGAGSYNGPGEYKYARVEAGTGTDGIDLSACNHNDDESHNVLIPFNQLFGGGQGVRGLAEYDGVTVTDDAAKEIEEMMVAELFAVTSTFPGDSVEIVSVGKFETLQEAINAIGSNAGEYVIKVLKDIEEDVTVIQYANQKITIKGDETDKPVIKGQVSVNGRSNGEEGEALTLKNLVFDAAGAETASVYTLDGGARYIMNLTIDSCDFITTGEAKKLPAIKTASNGNKNWTITNSTATDLHSLLQTKRIDGLVVDGCTVDCKNGINLDNSTDIQIKNSTINTDGYGVRIGEQGDSTEDRNLTLENNEIATTEEGAIVIRRGAEYSTVNITSGTYESENASAIVFGDSKPFRGVENLNLTISGGEFSNNTINVTVADAGVETSYGFDEFLADGLQMTVNEYGNYTPVADNSGTEDKAVATEITASLVPVEGNSNKYDVVLTANEGAEIHRFLSAELNLLLLPDEADESPVYIKNVIGNADYAIDVIDPKYNESSVWGFHLDVENEKVKEFTGAELKIATVELAGYGDAKFYIAPHANNKVEAIQSVDNNIVKKYIADNTEEGILELDQTINYVELKVPTNDLTIEITFPNPIKDQVAAYQNMKVVVDGDDIDAIETELGSDACKLVVDGDIVQYVVTIKEELTENNSYNITVTGAGYRTAEYRVTMTEDKTVYFWNNALKYEKDAKAIELGVSKPVQTTFLAGDIAEDNIIDKYDLAAVVSYFGKYNLTNSDATYKYAKYDLNRDGNIDSEDIAYVLASFGY